MVSQIPDHCARGQPSALARLTRSAAPRTVQAGSKRPPHSDDIVAAMRLTIIALVVAVGLIVDQLRFYGHYRRTAFDIVESSTQKILGYVRGGVIPAQKKT
jgi:hypothetical protein